MSELNTERQNAHEAVQEAIPANHREGYAYTAKEHELMQQLVKMQLQRNSELPYEDLEGYEVPSPTQFSMLKKPAVSIKYGKLTFNMASIRLLGEVEFIRPMVHSGKKKLTIIPVPEEEASSVQWARARQDGVVNREISTIEVVDRIFEFMGWKKECRYKVLGRVANSREGLCIVYELEEAIMFTAKPIEYLDEETGEIKKKQIKYYPDKYKDHIGKSYNDYIEAKQMNMFEDFDGYAAQTYSDGIRRMGEEHEASERGQVHMTSGIPDQ